MNEREMLEWAAKAAGINGFYNDWPFPGIITFDIGAADVPWNPRTNYGHALELAADLRLKIIPGKHPGDGCTVESQRAGIAGCTSFLDDTRLQMCSAIVHVAAEIGKAMP